MKIDLEGYNINKDYIVVEPVRQHDDLGPERGKYDMHSMGTILAVADNINTDVLQPGDSVIYDGTKSITIIESAGEMEFVPIDNILAIKERR